MISDFLFCKALRINIPEDQKREFYGVTVNIIAEYYQENPDWEKIMKLEETQWKTLSILRDINCPFYTASSASKEEIRLFVILILDEMKARLNLSVTGKTIYERELRRIINERMKFLEMMLEITDKDIADFKKNKWKWWLKLLGAGTVTILGFYGVRKLLKNNKNKKK